MEINTSLRTHQLERSEILAELHKYLPLINDRFYEGKLPEPALSYEPRGYRNLGTYRPEDGLALSHRINLNSVYADRPLSDIVLTLTHEFGHCWQHVYGKPSTPPYHNKEFRSKMSEIGIPCDNRGCSLGIHEPFISFIKELGIEGQVLQFKQNIEVKAGASRSRLRAWRCKCLRVWAWRDYEVDAVCGKCNSKFREQ